MSKHVIGYKTDGGRSIYLKTIDKSSHMCSWVDDIADAANFLDSQEALSLINIILQHNTHLDKNRIYTEKGKESDINEAYDRAMRGL